jgi:hypothetical protein
MLMTLKSTPNSFLKANPFRLLTIYWAFSACAHICTHTHTHIYIHTHTHSTCSLKCPELNLSMLQPTGSKCLFLFLIQRMIKKPSQPETWTPHPTFHPSCLSEDPACLGLISHPDYISPTTLVLKVFFKS